MSHVADGSGVGQGDPPSSPGGSEVRLGAPRRAREIIDLPAAAATCVGDHSRALDLAVQLGAEVPTTDTDPLRRWEVLATLAATDARVAASVEIHLHAVEVLHGLDGADPGMAGLVQRAVHSDLGSAWAVWANETGDPRLVADHQSGEWRLIGVQPACPLPGLVSHALVDAYVDGWRRGLFAVDLGTAGINQIPTPASATGSLPRADIAFQSVRAIPVMSIGWPEERPAADWGGIATAACWYGETVGTLRRALVARPLHDPVAQMHAAAADADLAAARAALIHAATALTGGELDAHGETLLALRTRATVGAAVERVLDRLGHTSGLQPRAHWDLAALGSRIAAGAIPTWAS